MKENLLCVVLAAPRHAGDVSDLMRMLRAMRDAADSLLLFCDLSDAFSSVLPEDDALIRSLQSGVMSLASRMPGRFLLLVRSRTWDDDARSYLGESQPICPHAVIAGLMASGHALSRVLCRQAFRLRRSPVGFLRYFFFPPPLPAHRMFPAVCSPLWANAVCFAHGCIRPFWITSRS